MSNLIVWGHKSPSTLHYIQFVGFGHFTGCLSHSAPPLSDGCGQHLAFLLFLPLSSFSSPLWVHQWFRTNKILDPPEDPPMSIKADFWVALVKNNGSLLDGRELLKVHALVLNLKIVSLTQNSLIFPFFHLFLFTIFQRKVKNMALQILFLP